MMDGINAGAVGVALFFQHIECPGVARIDREGRCPVALHRDTADIFQQPPRIAHVGGEIGGRLFMGQAVVVAVAGQFVPVGHNAPHQSGVAFGDPSQREKRGADAGRREHVQDARRVGFHASFQRVPVRAVDRAGEGLHLEPIFHIHRHRVQWGVKRGVGGARVPRGGWRLHTTLRISV